MSLMFWKGSENVHTIKSIQRKYGQQTLLFGKTYKPTGTDY